MIWTVSWTRSREGETISAKVSIDESLGVDVWYPTIYAYSGIKLGLNEFEVIDL